MSSGDEWFKRWGKMMPFGPWSYADVDEMMREMEKEFMALTGAEARLPKELVRERRAEDGSVTREVGPIVYGYSMTIGPDGKPVIREFGNVKRSPSKEWREAISDTREPLVDVVEGPKEVKVLAELPGAKKQDIELTLQGRSLVISADTPARKYRKELELPYAVRLEGSKSTFNNGILEVTLPKRRGRSSSVRIKVD
ncbi:MAG: Hsp20/alpha crystallin family protein [Thaumarchaeota archaeon]|nr:Hsp20/alpha crystallin family protein [Nitrososphaerota archaeon]